MDNNIKSLGQVFTPKNIVVDMLNLIDYEGKKILKKHIIDNSCGDGAFLKVIVERYICEYIKEYGDLNGVEDHLEKYIHGIEIDFKIWKQCLNNLNKIQKLFKLKNVNWNIVHADAIEFDKYDRKMDYVIGNPPYVRVHNLGDNFEKIRHYKLCKKGMTDLYILFYEIGFNMLNKSGVLCYITPNSFYTSNAGCEFRRFIFDNKNLALIADLGHYQPFKVSTYTTICKFENNNIVEYIDYFKYNLKGQKEYQERLSVHDIFVNGKIILSKKKSLEQFLKIQNYSPKNNKLVEVKNGFATLADKVFILESKIENCIKVLKASTGKWFYCLFPYNKNSKVVDFNLLSEETQKYLLNNKDILTKRSLHKKTSWYEFGRSQAIKDVYKNKIAINTTIKDVKSIKIEKVEIGSGVFSGLYILGNIDISEVKKYILTDEFIEYVRILNKCKSGGYFTFSSIDLKKYLIYKMENSNE